MDFKTGHPQDKDAEQIRAYGAVIQAMGYPYKPSTWSIRIRINC